MQQVGRNDPCPCGSGKKYKRCCLARDKSKTPTEESIRSRVVEDLLAFADESFGDAMPEALDFFWDDFDIGEQCTPELATAIEINSAEWLVHDWRPDEDSDKTLIEHYASSRKGLRERERAVLKKMNEAVLSLYEVQEVYRGEGLLLRDLLTDEEYRVEEMMATESLNKWDIFAARLLHIDGKYIMSGAAYGYPRLEKEALLKHLKRSFRYFRKEHPLSSMKDFLKQNGDLFNYYWCQIVCEPFIPNIVTRSGEPMMLCRAVFDINTDTDSLTRKLRALGDLHEAEASLFEWFETDETGDDSLLGSMEIQGQALHLVCLSEERFKRAKDLLLEHLSGSITHRIDTIQDPREVIQEGPESLQGDDNDKIPHEVQQELYSEFIHKHYNDWLNESIPALDGQTPLETVKKPWGKKKVAELLKMIENMEERKKQDGEPYVDISWLWERLGLDR